MKREILICDGCQTKAESMLRLFLTYHNAPPVTVGDFCSYECVEDALDRSKNTWPPTVQLFKRAKVKA